MMLHHVVATMQLKVVGSQNLFVKMYEVNIHVLDLVGGVQVTSHVNTKSRASSTNC